jgi:hypothetical protein
MQSDGSEGRMQYMTVNITCSLAAQQVKHDGSG